MLRDPRSRSKKRARSRPRRGRATARHSRYDTGAQAVRVRRVGGSRRLDQGLREMPGADRAPVGDGPRSGRSTSKRGAGRTGGSSLARDPRVPRFQGSGARLPSAATLPRHLAAAAAIPLNAKTALNVLALALVGWALIWLFTSERFYVRRVECSGNSRVSSEVLGQVSGLEGYSVFWVNPRRVSAQILEALPPIKSVQVHLGFAGPDGLGAWVRLQVREHGDDIMWQVAGQRYWVDTGGELHEVRGAAAVAESAPGAEGEAVPASGEPRLLIVDLRPALPDGVDPEALAGARQLVHLLPEVRALEYAPDTGLRLWHPRGWLVLLGTGEDMSKKVGVLRAMEVEFAGDDVVQPTLVDLRFPDSPYYRLPEASGPAGAD